MCSHHSSKVILQSHWIMNNTNKQWVLLPCVFSLQIRIMNASLGVMRQKMNSKNNAAKEWTSSSNHQVERLTIEILQVMAKQQWFYSFISWLCCNNPPDVQKSSQRMLPVLTVLIYPTLVYLKSGCCNIKYLLYFLEMCHLQLNKEVKINCRDVRF